MPGIAIMVDDSNSGGGDDEREVEGRLIGKPKGEPVESGIIVGLDGNSEKKKEWLDGHFGFLTYVWGLLLVIVVSLHFIRSPIIYHAGIFLMYTGAVIDIIEPNKHLKGVVMDCLGFFLAGILLFTCILFPGKCV